MLMSASFYSMLEHRHRLAVWVAGRAYSRKGSGHTVAVAQALIENSGLNAISSPEDLPEPRDVDAFIHQLIGNVIVAARAIPDHKHWKTGQLQRLECTYGRAQKLVNMYLKSKIVCAEFSEYTDRVSALHPPIDDQLIKAIQRNLESCPEQTKAQFKKQWATARKLGTRWTKFNQQNYDAYISAIRSFLAGRPLWQIEYLWLPSEDSSE
jgi:hypothetical protein